MSVAKTPNFIWLIIHPLVYIVWGPLWMLGVLNWNVLLNYNTKWWLLTNIIYFILAFVIYSAYVVWYYWEVGMSDLLWKTVLVVLFGVLIWFVLSLQTAL